MQKAFSLLELIIVVLVISIILTFALSKYNTIFDNTNLTKLKSEFILIQNGISNFKTKNVLLSNSLQINSLDEAEVLQKNEKLFTKVIDFSVLSTNSSDKEKGKWLKKSSSKYDFFLSNDKKVSFKLKDSIFACVSPVEICEELK